VKTNITPQLLSYLTAKCVDGVGGGEYVVIDLYTITLVNGTVLRWAAWPIPITVPANSGAGSGYTFLAAGPYLDRCRTKQTLKLEVSQMTLTLRASPTMTILGTPVLSAIQQGQFSGANVEVDRLFASSLNPFTVQGTVIWFVGQVAEVEELGRAHAKLTVKSPLALLSSPHPRNLYTTQCRHSLFDAGCGLSASSYTDTGVVGSGSTTQTVVTGSSRPGVIPSPTSANFSSSNLSAAGGFSAVNLPTATYYVVITYQGAGGESFPGPEYSIAISGGGVNGTTNKLLQVTPPVSNPGTASSWNLYVGTVSGGEMLQAQAIPFTGGGSVWTQSGNGLYQGVPPPSQPSSGWFTQGLITFTSGALNGTTWAVSSFTNTTGSNGTFTVVPVMPVAPSPGDTWSALPGCDKTMTTCIQKFNNLVHIAAHPFIPLPEQGV
jgi:hypothetical protein